jgi:hypothetical protein
MKNFRIAVITGPSQKIARKQILYAKDKCDGIELHAHYLEYIDFSSLLKGIRLCTILTAPSTPFFTYPFTYLDISYDRPVDFFRVAKQSLPETKIIASFHDFKKTPKDLNKILEKMLPTQADIFKIASLANSEEDANRMIAFAKEKNDLGLPFIGICMGAKGIKTRLCSLFDYRAIPFAKQTAEGQFFL